MSEHTPSVGDELYDELTAFVYERDRDFRSRNSDITTIAHPSYERYVGEIVDEEDPENIYNLYDSRNLTLKAKYVPPLAEHAELPSRRIIFSLSLVAITHFQSMPNSFRDYLPQETITEHQDGDLSQKEALTYFVRHDTFNNDRVMISQQSQFVIEDFADVLYDEQSHSKVLTLPRVTKMEEDEPIASLEAVPPQQTIDHTFTTVIQQDAARTVRGLLKVLRSSEPIPTFANLHEVVDRVLRK